jgi:hypothetical protein
MLKKTALCVTALGAIIFTSIVPAGAAEHISIPFASSGGIDEWRAESDRVLYLRSRTRDWYRAELIAPCEGLNFVETIGYVPASNGSFDSTSTILVDGRRCVVMKLEKSAEPTRRKK